MNSSLNFNTSDKQPKNLSGETESKYYNLDDYDKVNNLVRKICSIKKVDQSVLDGFVHIFYLMYRLFNHDNVNDLFISILYIIRNFYRDLFGSFEDYIKNKLRYVVDVIQGKKNVVKVKCESSELKFSSTMRYFVNSRIFGVVREFILDLVSLRFFNKPTGTMFTRTLGKPVGKPVFDACIDICESIEQMFNFLHRAWKAGSLRGVLMEDTPLLKFFDLYQEISLAHPHIYIGDEDNFKNVATSAGRMSAFKFMEKVRLAIKMGEELILTHKDSKLKMNLAVLRNIYVTSLHKLHSKNRKMPIGFVVHGKPGIGKSSIINHIYKLVCKKRDLKFSKDLVFDRLMGANFWDGFDPLTHLILHYPEVGAMSERLATMRGDPTAEELLKVMDTAPMQAEQADVVNKGKFFVNPDAVVIDTNNSNMNLRTLVSNPAAVRRRFIYIQTTVKQKFQMESSEALDPEKVAILQFDDEGNKKFKDMDLFVFQVYRLIPLDNINSKREVLLENGNIFELTSVLMNCMDKHDRAQDAFANAMQDSIDEYVAQSSFYEEKKNLICNFFLFLYYWLIDFVYSSNSCKKHKLQLIILLCKIKYEDAFGKPCNVRNVANSFFNSHWYGDVLLVCYMLSFGFVVGKTFCKSQGDLVDSSGDFPDIDTCRTFTNDVLEKSGVEFPRAAKKKDGCQDYDDPRTSFPKIISSERNYNSFDEVYNSIIANTRRFKIKYAINNMVTDGTLVGIKGDYAIMNTHYFLESLPIKEIHISGSHKRLNFRVVRPESIQYKHLGNDITLVKLFTYQFKDISFVLNDDLHKYDNCQARILGFSTRADYQVTNLVATDPLGNSFTSQDYYRYNWPDNAPGMCGNPLVGRINNQTFMLGIHAAACKNYAYSVRVNTQLLEAIDNFGCQPLHTIYSEGQLRLKKFSTDLIKITDVSKKSAFLYEDTSGTNILGFIKDYKFITAKSTLVLSPVVSKIKSFLKVDPYDEDGNLKWDKPLMRSRRTKSGEYIHPYNLFVSKVSVVKKDVAIAKLKDVVTWLSCYLISSLKKEGIKRLAPVDLDVALNGTHNNFYMRSMKFSTSAGFSFNGKKGKYAQIIPGSQKRSLGYDVHEQVCEIIKSYNNEETSLCVLGAQLKDEPRTREKCVKGKTRVFAMSPFDMTLVQRMYLMSFYSLMVEFRDVFKASIGINMHSSEAHDMYTELKNFSPYFLLGDYGGYDTSMPIGLGLSANSIVLNVVKYFGYNEEAQKIVTGILNDNLFPIISLEGNLVQIPGFQPSGKYATAEDNSLRNLILLLIAFRDLCSGIKEIDINDPFKYICPKIYGDDLVCGVKEEVLPFFNNVSYAVYCQEHYGMKFTTADKREHTRESCPIDEIEYLKRKFRYSKILKRYVACLSKDSLLKTLTWILPSKDISIHNQVYESTISVLTELFFWCDSYDEYDEYFQEAKKFLEHIQIDGDLLPSFTILYNRYTSL